MNPRPGWFCLVILPLCACSSAIGGPVAGAADTHCGTEAVVTSASACAGGGAPADAGMAEEETARFNTEADDDDCKYHVSYAVTPVSLNAELTFTVTLTNKSDGRPATGADTRLEAFLGDTHPAPGSGATTRETSPGTYVISPVRFDKSGQWTARFHFFESCSDVAAASPHGHAAFLIEVP
jgi:hypothetical protein